MVTAIKKGALLGSSGEIKADPTKFYNYYWITMSKFDYSLEIIKGKFDKNYGTNYNSGVGKGWARAQRQLFYRVLTEEEIEVMNLPLSSYILFAYGLPKRKCFSFYK